MGEAGQQAGLGQVQVAGRLAEVGPGSRLRAVGQVAVVHLVQVQLQDLVLAQMAGQPHRQDHLPCLSPQASRTPLLRRQVEITCELLCDRAASGDDLTGFHVLGQSSSQGQHVEARVAVEAAVLHRNGCLAQRWSDLREAQVAVGALLGQGYLIQQPPIAVQDLRAVA